MFEDENRLASLISVIYSESTSFEDKSPVTKETMPKMTCLLCEKTTVMPGSQLILTDLNRS
jgi:hypothetical protein